MNFVRKAFIFCIIIVLAPWEIRASGIDTTTMTTYDSLARAIYQNLNTEELTYDAFSNAFIGYQQLMSKNLIEKRNIITIIDFNKSSKEERFFIIDLSKQDVIHESLVAHGKNSGWDIPSSFSNKANSYKSSLGFYITGETYTGKHGLSLKLDGLERGINDNARKRQIVIHAADYVSESFAKKVGRLGRSYGCPSLPSENYNQIIDLIKDKSLIFIYSNQRDYFIKSEYL